MQRERREHPRGSQGTRPQAGQGDGECPRSHPCTPAGCTGGSPDLPMAGCVCAPLLRRRCAAPGGGSQQLARARRGRGGCSHSPGAARPRLIRQGQLQAEARGATPRIHMAWGDSAAGEGGPDVDADAGSERPLSPWLKAHVRPREACAFLVVPHGSCATQASRRLLCSLWPGEVRFPPVPPGVGTLPVSVLGDTPAPSVLPPLLCSNRIFLGPFRYATRAVTEHGQPLQLQPPQGGAHNPTWTCLCS